MTLRRFLTVLAGVMVLAMAVVVWFFPSREDFRPDNPYWNGISEAASDHRLVSLRSLSALPSSPDGDALVLIPYLDMSAAELRVVGDFVSRGGTLILADDYGYGNRVAEYLGLRARFAGKALRDPLLNYKTGWFPRISELGASPLTEGVGSLVLNHATGLIDVEPYDILARSSPFSFIDLNGNGAWDKGEPMGPIPVVARQFVGSGQVVLVSDPSLFINGMEEIEGNRRFIDNIVAAGPVTFIDQSHLPATNLRTSKYLLSDVRGYLATLPGTFGLVVVGLALALAPMWHRRATRERST